MQNPHILILPSLLALGVACGDDVTEEITPPNPQLNEEIAMEAANAAGEALRVLGAVSSVTLDSADAQDDTSESPQTPPSAQSPCVTVALGSDLSLTVDHGTGCQVRNAFVSGAYVLRLLRQPQLGLVIEFQAFSINELSIDGTIRGGISFGQIDASMDLDVTLSGTTHEFDFTGTLAAQAGTLQIDGSGSYGTGAAPWTFDVADVHMAIGDCYPHSGSMQVTIINGLPATITFTNTTRQTGLVQVTVGSIPFGPVPLPPYGNCPSGA